jgi:hypothetical protein
MVWSLAPGKDFSDVDPTLLGLLQRAAANSPYNVTAMSGFRPGDPRQHGRGHATDVQLVDPKTGVALTNYQSPENARAYQQYANAVYNAATPEQRQALRWGGYFRDGGPGHYGALDLMHFDINSGLPMAGGSFQGGFSPEQASLWKMQPGGGVGNTAPAAPTVGGQPGTQGAPSSIEAYIRQSAATRGIDPDIAVKVARSEGGLTNPTQQSNYVANGVRETSYGPFQLRIGGGLGDAALKAGIDPRDPNQWQKGVDFALDQVKQGGWGPWMGAQKQGITGMMGVGTATGHAPDVSSPQAATDAAGPGQRSTAPAQTTQPAPGTPGGMQGPPNPPGWSPGTTYQPPARSDLAGEMLAGLKNTLGDVGKAMTSSQAQPSLAGLAPDPTSLAPSQAVGSTDPQAAQIQQQRMALALQRLNSGRLV